MSKIIKQVHPDWALQHKQKGTELRLLNGTYYLYQVTSKWNPQKKRAQKITGKLLGKITPEGFFESDKERLRKAFQPALTKPLEVKEYGMYYLAHQLFDECIIKLKLLFPDIWQEIVSLAMIRLLYKSPIKNVALYFTHSYLSEQYNDISLSEKRVRALYKKIGINRELATTFMNGYLNQKDNMVLIDATNLITHSKKMEIAHIGYNTKQEYDPQVNIMFLFSMNLQLPVFYRIIPGNVREVTAFKLTMEEAKANQAVIIADKGFYSEENIQTMDSFKLQYIIPLRRNNLLIDYSNLSISGNAGFDGYFSYRDRYIWYKTSSDNNKFVTLYFDQSLKTREEHDYLSRIKSHPEEFTIEKFKEKHIAFGTIALYSNISGKSAEEIYANYKVRGNIETMIDAFKNTLHADSSYMQDEQTFNGWIFINFIALQWYYKVYQLLNKKELIKRFAPNDIFEYLKEIRKIKINGTWVLAEMTKATKDLLHKIDLPIT
jgi:transposase